jgi:hypothetical protein
LLIQRLLDHLKELDTQVDELELQIVKWHRQSSASSKLAQVPGIGPITASALVASLGDAKTLTADVKWRCGWDLCLGSIQVEESKTCWASASGGTHTFESERIEGLA